jgi:hypothetical protein
VQWHWIEGKDIDPKAAVQLDRVGGVAAPNI